MTRVKTSLVTRRRHKKIKGYAKGFYNKHKRSFRLANQLTRRAMVFRFEDNRNKKRIFRSRFIQVINSFARELNSNYSRFINLFNKSDYKSSMDRKSLCLLIQHKKEDAVRMFTPLLKRDV